MVLPDRGTPTGSKQQWPAKPVKTDGSEAPIPIPNEPALMLAAAVKRWPGDRVVSDPFGKSEGGANIKVVQARMRHAPAKATLDACGHLWPDTDETTRRVIAGVITERMDSASSTAYSLHTESPN